MHVGAGTFVPVKTDNIKDHVMHSETFEISQATINKINQTKANGGRIFFSNQAEITVGFVNQLLLCKLR
nr:S-adenosylmethionine:tRNA ribosyltransferase-isomerase [Isorropodon fossajaponicum symbiont]